VVASLSVALSRGVLVCSIPRLTIKHARIFGGLQEAASSILGMIEVSNQVPQAVCSRLKLQREYGLMYYVLRSMSSNVIGKQSQCLHSW
jgi:hypothetical protein